VVVVVMFHHQDFSTGQKVMVSDSGRRSLPSFHHLVHSTMSQKSKSNGKPTTSPPI
jgi:hypothetical protein